MKLPFNICLNFPPQFLMRLQSLHSLTRAGTGTRNKAMKSHLECSRKCDFSKLKIRFNDLDGNNCLNSLFTLAGQSLLAKVSKLKKIFPTYYGNFSWCLKMMVSFWEFWYISSTLRQMLRCSIHRENYYRIKRLHQVLY